MPHSAVYVLCRSQHAGTGSMPLITTTVRITMFYQDDREKPAKSSSCHLFCAKYVTRATQEI
jgi:hypothetical protein